MTEDQPFKVCRKPELQNSSLVIGWDEDAGSLGSKIIDYLNDKLGGQEFAEIEPTGFFQLGGVSVQGDIAQFPESKFYYCQDKNLVMFKSTPPRAEWYRFLNSILDVAENYCNVKELYTIGGMVALNAHTSPRELLAIGNSPEMADVLKQFGLLKNIDHETPPGQRPTLNSFLSWLAKKRNIRGANIWASVPVYLLSTEDPQSWRKIIDFFDRKLSLGIDFTDLDREIARQNGKIAQARSQYPELDGYIHKLESNFTLTEEEGRELAKEMDDFLRENG